MQDPRWTREQWLFVILLTDVAAVGALVWCLSWLLDHLPERKAEPDLENNLEYYDQYSARQYWYGKQ